MSPPLVTLAIVTRDRPRLLKRALYYAGRQTYSNCDVVIVDDGRVDLGGRVQQWCPRWPVRYLRSAGVTLGRKRNLAAWASEAEYVAHWDDDDWYAPDRIAKQVTLLEATGRGITGTPVAYVYDVRRQRAARTRLDNNVQGNTLFYRRALQLVHPFWNQDTCEDQQFFRLNDGHRAVEDDLGLVVYVMHGGNVTGTPGFDWGGVNPGIIWELLGPDRAFYDRFGADLGQIGGQAYQLVSDSSPAPAAHCG